MKYCTKLEFARELFKLVLGGGKLLYVSNYYIEVSVPDSFWTRRFVIIDQFQIIPTACPDLGSPTTLSLGNKQLATTPVENPPHL